VSLSLAGVDVSHMSFHRMVSWSLVAVVALLLAAGLSLGAASPVQALERLAQCANNVDDDGDGKVDFPAEPGCTSANDPAEADPVPAPACSNRLDDDGDGVSKIDFPAEPGCASAADTTEVDPVPAPECADLRDNDGDVKIDYLKDPGCNWAADTEADTDCSNGRDDDSDGRIDFPDDLGCAGLNDADEVDPPQCNDGRDNDGDGTLDFDTGIPTQAADSDCESAVDTVEAPRSAPPPVPAPPARCADGLDNDGDGKVDFPADRGCSSAADDDEIDTQLVVVVPSSIPTPLLTPFPVVRLRGRTERDRVRITLLTVRAPAASQVSIYCTGRSCPRRRLAMRASRRIVRVRPFERRLRAGAVLKIYVTKPGFIGKYTRFRFMRNRVPLRADRCAKAPGTQPRTCPAS